MLLGNRTFGLFIFLVLFCLKNGPVGGGRREEGRGRGREEGRGGGEGRRETSLSKEQCEQQLKIVFDFETIHKTILKTQQLTALCRTGEGST